MNNALHEVFEHTLQDAFSAEKQLTAALPKVADAARNSELREALSNHLAETRQHVQRIEQVCQTLGIRTGDVTCQGMAGLIRETQENIEKFGSGPGGDAAIIACAQKVEHYEICAYGTLIEWAKKMDHKNVLDPLQETLKEESEANEKLTKIAKKYVNDAAVEAEAVSRPNARLM